MDSTKRARNLARALGLVLPLALCASCATLSGPAATPVAGSPPAALAAEGVPRGMGRVVFGRPNSFAASAATFRFIVERAKTCEITNGTWCSVLVEAGERDLEFQNLAMGGLLWGQVTAVAVPEGGTVYFEYRPTALTPAGMFAAQASPTLDYAGLARVAPFVAAVYADGRTAALDQAAPAKAPPAPAIAPAPAKASPAPAPAAARAAPPKGRSSLAKNVIAVVIGNKDYERGAAPVVYALNDAAAFRAALERSFGLDPKDIWYQENAGLADFISLFGADDGYRKSRIYRTASMRDAPADLVIYYSGHGAPSTSGATKGKGYLVPVDADLLAVQSTGYSIDTLLANVAAMKAEGVIGRSWISFDACFSGQSGDGGLLIKNVSGLGVVPVAPKAKIPESVVMFAASGEEFASWYPEEGHGLFTHFLLKGLGGAADADGNRSIEIRELESYLRKWVPRYANGLNAQEQTPQVISSGEIAGFLALLK